MYEEHNFSLVQAKGMLKTKEVLKDEKFNIKKEGTIIMKRKVEVLQWVEHQTARVFNGRNEVFFDYTKEWREHMVDQSLFGRGMFLE